MQASVNTDFDLPYDTEDLGLTSHDLRQKYQVGHTYYTVEQWIRLDDDTKAAYPDYWKWVAAKIDHDDLNE